MLVERGVQPLFSWNKQELFWGFPGTETGRTPSFLRFGCVVERLLAGCSRGAGAEQSSHLHEARGNGITLKGREKATAAKEPGLTP